MISEKRRREIISEFGKDAKRFAEAWRLASAYAQAGDMVMHDFFMAIMQPSRFQHTPEEKAWVQASMMEGASKRRKELLAEAAERLMHVFNPLGAIWIISRLQGLMCGQWTETTTSDFIENYKK